VKGEEKRDVQRRLRLTHTGGQHMGFKERMPSQEGRVRPGPANGPCLNGGGISVVLCLHCKFYLPVVFIVAVFVAVVPFCVVCFRFVDSDGN